MKTQSLHQHPKFFGLIILLSLFALAMPAPAAAAIRYVKWNAVGLDNGDSWTNAYTNLQTALTNAVSGDELWVAAGTYKPTTDTNRTISFALKSGVALYGGFAGTETIRSQRNWTTNVTIMSGDIGTPGNNSDNSYHVVYAMNINNTAVLDGFTITGGNATGSAWNFYGGGMYNDQGSPTVTNCSFNNNYAGYGGGMYNVSSSLTVTNCAFTGNTATSGDGGGMYNVSSSPTVTNCAFNSNTAFTFDGGGGGMYNNDSSNPTVTNCTFSSNAAPGSGGSGGGGMYNNNSSNPTVTNCTFSSNSASASLGSVGFGGGGIYNNNSSNPTVTNCTFSSNIVYGSGGSGGGMYNVSSSPTVTNCTFSSNSAATGREISNNSSSNATIINTILWNTLSGAIYNDSSIPTFKYSDIKACGGSAAWDIACGDDGGSNVDRDPRFVSPPGDLHLTGDSPCINGGTNPGAPTADMDSDLRPFDAKADIGADEFTGAFLDMDGDGLLDYWEYYYFGDLAQVPAGDPDNDGATNAQEFQAGTHPQQPLLIYVATSGNNTNDGRTAATAKLTIQAGINVVGEGGEVIVLAGAYTGSGNRDLDFKGKALTLRSETSDPTTTTIDVGCTPTGCPGASDYHRGFYFHRNETAEAVVQGFTIQNGYADAGGGIKIEAASPTITNCIIKDSTATQNGGGIALFTGAKATINACTIRHNTRQGMYIHSSDPTIINCRFSETVNGNGLRNYNASPTILNSVFESNAHNGIYNFGFSNPTIIGCIFRANAQNGICNDGSSPTITNSVFTENTQNGMLNWYSAFPIIQNCTFYGNLRPMTNNFTASPVITNSIFWAGTTPPIQNVDAESKPTVAYSAIQGGLPTGCTDGGGNIYPAAPLFVNISDPNGGDDIWGTDDDGLRLQGASPCLDVGKNLAGIYADIRGSLRPMNIIFETGDGPVNNNFDLGAYEYSIATNDVTVKAFKEINLNSTLLIAGYEYVVSWKNNATFPKEDLRITQPQEYTVRFALIGGNGRRVELGTAAVSSNMPLGYGYTAPITFPNAHVGTWTLRVEMADDRTQFADKPAPITIEPVAVQTWVIGQAITPPPEADSQWEPSRNADAQHKFYWDANEHQLYAIAPTIPPNSATLTWYTTTRDPLPVVGDNVWPTTQQRHVVNAAPVDLRPSDSPYIGVEVLYSESGAPIPGTNQFTATIPGKSVLRYVQNDNTSAFVIVDSIAWDDADYLTTAAAAIGVALTSPDHASACDNGFVFQAIAPYAVRTTTGSTPADGYDRATRQGPIIPVNEDLTPADASDDLAVAWYQQDATSNVCWPHKMVRYTPQWPTAAPELTGTIVIARGDGSGAFFNTKSNVTIYNQPDQTKAGYNPNEEHALLVGAANAVYALRTDLNPVLQQSEPYVLVKYLENGAWQFAVFQVEAEQTPDDTFVYAPEAGALVEAPYPLNTLLPCPESAVTPAFTESSSPWWKDYAGNLYAKKAGSGTARYFYPLRSDFFYDLNLDGAPDNGAGQCIPWLDRLPGGTTGTPMDVTYTITWPDPVPVLSVGDTLITPKNDLPDIKNQCSVKVIYDQPYHDVTPLNNANRSVKLLKMLTPYLVDLDAPISEGGLEYINFQLPAGLRTTPVAGEANTVRFPDLPPDLIMRLTYNEASQTLNFAGYYGPPNYYDPGSGALEVLLPNIMSATEQATIINKLLAENPGVSSSDPNYASFQTAIETLFDRTRATLAAGESEVTGATTFKVLSAADTTGGIGYVTLAFNDHQAACASNPVSLEVIQVGCGTLAAGAVSVFEPENVFDERVTFRHSGDFAGQTASVTFDWRYADALASDSCDPDGNPYPPATTCASDPWQPLASAAGLNTFLIGGAGLDVLRDKYLTVQYTGYAVRCPASPGSAWTSPQIYENWVKRVVKRINPFEQRFYDFHTNAAATYVSMIQQAGQRYEGPVALNADPAYLNTVGLIELYHTVVRRARQLSIDAEPPADDQNANLALLLGASRVVDLYMLLGNEAYGDAADPSIGFTTQSVIGPGITGSVATTLFAFQDQAPSLLTEELELLRGRDSSRTPSVTMAPAYHRLRWNFTSGTGQVAYVNNYNAETEAQAKTLFPQGHGDAWGHYLTALKTYYNLLRHPAFTWLPCPENLLVAGEPVLVDFGDEREFVAAAVAKARTGAEIVNLTYRQAYLDKPEAQWQGYKDTDATRAWGLAEWAARAGQGAYLDWVTANALLPVDDSASPHPVDRQNVTDLQEIASRFAEIQRQVAQANIGLNPLGVAKDAIPFDIDPLLVDSGKTHFEQIYDRALQALNNARLVFDYANQFTQMLRKQQETTETFQQNTAKQERDYTNRLIEIFGYPYSDDIGAGKTYPAGYDGPDLYHFDYVDVSQLMKTNQPDTETITVIIKKAAVDDEGTVSYPEELVSYHISREAGLGLIKPSTWTGTRRAPGEIQQARSELLVARERLNMAKGNYEALLAKIEGRADLFKAQHDLDSAKFWIKFGVTQTKLMFNIFILQAKITQAAASAFAEICDDLADASAEALPKSVGMSSDVTSVLRSVIKTGGVLNAKAWKVFANLSAAQQASYEFAKETVEMEADLAVMSLEQQFTLKEKLEELKEIVCDESTLRAELFIKQEEVTQAIGRYAAALAKGERLLQERTAFRQKVADDVREVRYADMAFRIFRSEALQKYRAQFDLAARYVYLAAKAYDYDTGLLSTLNTAGEKFFTDIVKARLIGKLQDGIPVTGSGLAHQMAQMAQNFAVLKGQMGFNNPQIEDNRFSLRTEHFRRLAEDAPNIDAESEAGWQQVLHSAYAANLWDVPEFRQLCRAFSANTQVEPALVIPFRTTITSRLNFFGWPLSGGDSYYDASRFATKIRRVGVWFKDYDTAAMAYTPRVYLVPAGADFIRVPFSNSINTRSFTVVDQIIPVPFPLSDTEIEEPTWSPMTAMADSGQDFLAIRRYSRMRAYPYTGDTGWENQLQWDSRLIGRSVWNGEWLLIIPGSSLSSDAEAGLDAFINSVTDILFTFQTYSYEGYGKGAKASQQAADMIPE